MERRDWKAAAQLEPPSAALAWASFPYAPAITYFAQAIGASRVGELDRARSALRQIETIHAGLQKSPIPGPYDWTNQVESARLAAAAWLAYAEGQKDEAVKMARAAAQLEEKTGKHPVTPGAPLPARELLGDMLLEMGQPAEALAAYEASLREAPNRFNSLYGAARAAERSQNTDRARGALRRAPRAVRRRLAAARAGRGAEIRGRRELGPQNQGVEGRPHLGLVSLPGGHPAVRAPPTHRSPSMSLVVLGGGVSPFVRKVRVVLAEKGLDYQHEQVNPFAPPAGYREISPLGKIPAFKDGDRTLADSSVICAYLEKRFPTPALYPSDPYDYARALWIEEFMDGGLVPVVGPNIFLALVLKPLLLRRQGARRRRRGERPEGLGGAGGAAARVPREAARRPRVVRRRPPHASPTSPSAASW